MAESETQRGTMASEKENVGTPASGMTSYAVYILRAFDFGNVSVLKNNKKLYCKVEYLGNSYRIESQAAPVNFEREWTNWVRIEAPSSSETVSEPDKQALVETGKDVVKTDTETNTSEGDDSIVKFTIIEEDEGVSCISTSQLSGVIAAKDLFGSRLKFRHFKLAHTDGSYDRVDLRVASVPLESVQLERPASLRVDIFDHSSATSYEVLFLEASGKLQRYYKLNENEINCLQADKICAMHIRGEPPYDIFEEVPLHNALGNSLPHWHDTLRFLLSAYDPREVCLSALSLFEQLGRLFVMVQSQLNDASRSIVTADTSRDMLLQLLSSAGTSLQFSSKEDESCFLNGIESNGIGGVDAQALAQLFSDLHVLAQSSSPDTQPGHEEALQRVLVSLLLAVLIPNPERRVQTSARQFVRHFISQQRREHTASLAKEDQKADVNLEWELGAFKRILSENMSEVLAVHRVVHSPESRFDSAYKQRVAIDSRGSKLLAAAKRADFETCKHLLHSHSHGNDLDVNADVEYHEEIMCFLMASLKRIRKERNYFAWNCHPEKEGHSLRAMQYVQGELEAVRNILKRLVETGADLNARSVSQESHFEALVRMRDNETLKVLASASLTPRAVRANLGTSWKLLFEQFRAHQDECSAVLETLLGVQAALVRAQVPDGYCEAVFEACEELGHVAINELFRAQLGDSVTVKILRRMFRKVHGEDGHTQLSLFSVRQRQFSRYGTSLQAACNYGYIECVRELISYGADIHTVPRNGCTPMHIAVGHHFVEIVRLFCTEGARRDDAALLSSVENGQVEILQILHSHWPEAANPYRGELDRTLLHIACERQGSREDKIVPALIQMGVSVNEVDVIGRTALHNATSMGNLSAVRCLMEAGADDTLPTRLEGSTIIHEAAKKGRISVLQFLLQNASGETVDALDRRGRTPVCYAFDRRKYLEMALFCLFESVKCASHKAIRNMSFTGEIKTFASLIEQRYSSPHRSKQEKNEIKVLKGKLKIMCGSAFESDVDTSFPIFDENVLSFFPEESCRALGAMDFGTPEKELKSMLRDVIEALFVEIRRADAILGILLEAGADIDHVDDNEKPAFDDAYRLEYFETKRDELETAFVRRSGLAHDQPIFRDKIMHQAVHAAWVDQGLRFKALRALAYWTIVLGLLTLVAIRYSGRDVYESYSIQATISNRVSSGTAGDLEDVSDLDSWNDYVENVFIEALWPAANVPDLSSNENMLGGGLTFLGRPRYRQIRTLPESCSATMPSLLPAADATCYAPYSQGTFKALDDTLENRTDFACKLRDGTSLDIAWEDSPAVPFFGKFGFYKGGGVSVVLPSNSTRAQRLLQDLRACDFLTMQTRLAVLEFTLYSRAHELFVHGRVFMEQTTAGGVFVGQRWETRKLVSYESADDRSNQWMEWGMSVLLLLHFGGELRRMTKSLWRTSEDPIIPRGARASLSTRVSNAQSFEMPDRLGESSLTSLIILDQEEQEWCICEATKTRTPDDSEGRWNIQIHNSDKVFDPQNLRWLPTGKHVKDGHFAIGQAVEVAAGPNRQACSGMIVGANVRSEPCTYSVFTFSSPSVLLQYVPENVIREVSHCAIAEIRSSPRGNKFLARSTAPQHRKGVGLLRAKALDLIHAGKDQFVSIADKGFFGVLTSLFGDISPYWSDPFNYIDLSIMFLSCALVAAHLSLLSKVADKRVGWQETSASNVFIDVSDVMWYATIRQYLLAGVVFLCYLKTLEYLRVAATFAIPVMIIIGMLVKLMSFLAILAVFVLAFGLFDYVVFGLKYAPANSVMKALVFTVRGALGELDFDGKYEMDQIVGTGMTMLAAVLLVILLLNLLIAVMSEAYEEVKSTAEARWCYMQFAAIYRREQGAEFWTILWQSRPVQALRILIARCFNAGGLSAQQQVVPVNVSDRTDVVEHEGSGKPVDPNRD